MKSSRIDSGDATSFTITSNGSGVRATSTAYVSTPFMSIAGVAKLPIVLAAEALLSRGNEAGTNLEISVMVDVSGSMSGSKIADLRTAATDLVNIVVWDDQSQHTSKVAFVPFAARVNVGSYASAVTGLPAVSNGNGNGGNGGGKGGTNKHLIPCVTERIAVNALNDEAPGNGGNSYVGAYDANSGTNSYSTSGNCSNPEAEILPLTGNKSTLTNYISTLKSESGTAGQLGTAWAWYMISPKWSGIWPAASKPAPYSDLTAKNSNGLPKLKKIAILMTDGQYDDYQGGWKSPSWVSANAVAICNNMKAAGIEVYTVGFQLPNGLPKDTLAQCATDSSHAYEASTGDALRQAFRDIALKLATLRVSM